MYKHDSFRVGVGWEIIVLSRFLYVFQGLSTNEYILYFTMASLRIEIGVYKGPVSLLKHVINCIVSMQAELKAQLRAGLASLPAPSNDFEIVLPEVRNRLLLLCSLVLLCEGSFCDFMTDVDLVLKAANCYSPTLLPKAFVFKTLPTSQVSSVLQCRIFVELLVLVLFL